jgi:Flp pilus assembly CpaE family ATPase
MAEKIIVVCTPELNTLRDVRECLRVFGEIIHLDNGRLCFVFNNHQPFVTLAREQFEAALEQQMEHEIPHAGEAAYKAAAKGEPLVRSSSGSAFSKAVEKLTRAVIPAEAKPSRKGGLSLLNRNPRPAQPKPAPTKSSGGLLSLLRGKRAS